MKRIPEIDSWRGLLIFFVVLGHVVGMSCHVCVDGVKSFMTFFYKVIYVFHMPAFFFLAGMTWSRREEEGFMAFVAKKARRLLIPYLVFGVLSGVLFYLMASSFFTDMAGKQDGYYASQVPAMARDMVLSLVHAGGWPENGVFRGNSVLWFLPAMFSADVIYWLVDKCCPRVKWQIIVISLLYAIGFFVPMHLPWGLSRALNLVAFLAIGRWGADTFCQRELSWKLFVVLAAPYIIICFVTPNHWIVHESFLWYVLFDLMGLLGILLSYRIAKWAVNWTWVPRLGMMTLGVMLLHKYFIVALQSRAFVVNALCRSGHVGALFVVLAITAFVTAASFALSIVIRMMCPWALGESRKLVKGK